MDNNNYYYSWFLFPFLSILLSLPIFFFLHLKLYCKCQICQTYIQSRWLLQFPNLCDWYTHLLQNSPNHTIHIHILNSTITANPHNLKHILKTNFHNFPKGKPFSSILGDFLGRGIFNVDGDSWRFQRKMASCELNRASVRDYSFHIANREVNRRLLPLMESVAMDGDKTLDLQEVFKRFSFDCICRFSFGLDPKCLEMTLMPLSEFASVFDLASELSAKRAMAAAPVVWKMKRWMNIGSEKRLREAIKTVHMLAEGIIGKRREFGVYENGKDLLSKLMRKTDDERYLRDIIVSFLLAGRDTVAAALTSFFWLLAQHPEVEEEILAEVESKMGINPNQESFTYDQLQGVHYLHGAIYESLRLYPPIQFDSKFCLEDDFLPDGSFVKRGTRVTYHPYAMGRMEHIWGLDFLEFKPQRWIKNGVFCPHHNEFEYPVFQPGIRVCLGKEMAIMEIKLVVVSILRRFRVRLEESNKISPRFSPGLTAVFRDGLPVRVCTRAGNGGSVGESEWMESNGGD